MSAGDPPWSPHGGPGVEAPEVSTFSGPTAKRCSRAHHDANLRAVIVGVLLKLDILRNSIARISALTPPGLSAALRSGVRFAGASSWLNRIATRKSAPVHIVAVGRSAEKKLVYNLTIADAHLFYANGILSSNTDAEDHAGDETRYRLRWEGGGARSGRIGDKLR